MSSQDTIDSTEITILVHGKIEKQTKDVLNNIRKLFILLDSDNIESNYWKKSPNLKRERFPFPKQKANKKAE